MRRTDKEITDRTEIDAIINQAQVCHLAMAQSNRPYIVPLNFGYEDGIIYIHSATEGMKLDIIRENQQVCIEFEVDIEVVSGDYGERCTTKYRSAIAFGHASIVTDIDEKRHACDVLMHHYTDHNAACPDDILARTTIIRIDIESITGKQSG